MTKVLYLDYIALLIYILIIIALSLRSNKSLRRQNLFAVLIAVSVFATIYDICAVTLDNTGRGAVVLKYILHIGYLILRNLITPIFGAYVISLTDTWHNLYRKKIIQKIIWIPFLTVAILTLSSPVTHWVFYLDLTDSYTRGPLFFILYISAVFYTAFCLYYAIKNANVLKRESLLPLVSIAPSQAAAVIIQLIYPNILCEMIATSLCLMLLMLTVERPSSKIDATTGLLKSTTFMENEIRSFQVSKPETIILINITNHAAINSYFSMKNMEAVYQAIIKRVKAVDAYLNMNNFMYNLESGLFAVTIPKNHASYAPRYSRHILDSLNHPCKVNSSSISFSPNVCVIKTPEDIDNMDALNVIIKEFRRMKYSGEVILASNMAKGNDYTVMANMDAILAEAISNNLFEVYYQPIYSTQEKRITSAEALIRLRTKEYGFIRPDLFIPMAEESGAIHKIGMFVFEEVCKFIASEEFKALNVDYIEVNLSVVQAMERNLDMKILNMMKKYKVDPSQINLELTETASSFTQKNMTSNVNMLHTAGISFSLDDFGTGYSNMVRIASLPLSLVKLDKSFTWTRGNEELKLVLEKTIKLIKNMNMHIVVEGVEDADMLNYFESLGCEYIQGYYFSKPLPKDDFVAYVQGEFYKKQLQ